MAAGNSKDIKILNGPLLSEYGFNHISSKLGHEWQHVIFRLGITKPDVDIIHENYPTQTRRQIIEALMLWRKRSDLGGHDMIKELSESLQAEERMDIVMELKEAYRTDEIEFCHDHLKEEVTRYCMKCRRLICPLCLQSSHRKHSIKTIADAATKRKKRLKQMLDFPNDGLLEEVQNEKEILEDMRKMLKTDFERSVTNLRIHHKEMIKAMERITKHAEDEMGSLIEKSNQVINGYERDLSEITDTIKDIRKTFNETERETKCTADTKIIKISNRLNSALKAMNEGQSKLIKVKSPVFERTVPDFDDQIQSLMTWKQTACVENQKQKKREHLYGSYSLGRIHKRESYIARSMSYDISGESKDFIELDSLEKIGSFQFESAGNELHTISAKNSEYAYISYRSDEDNLLSVVYKTGQIGKSWTSNSLVKDFSTEDGGVLVKSRKISKLNGDVIARYKGRRPISVYVTASGYIAGVVDSYDYSPSSKSSRVVVKMCKEGNINEEFETDDSKTRLFTLPEKVRENTNGDIWVMDKLSDTRGRIVVLHPDGSLNFIQSTICIDGDSNPLQPTDMCATQHGLMIVSDERNCLIVLTNDGEVHQLIKMKDACIPTCISFCADDSLWIGFSDGNVQIRKYLL